jgi:hypothetical protein
VVINGSGHEILLLNQYDATDTLLPYNFEIYNMMPNYTAAIVFSHLFSLLVASVPAKGCIASAPRPQFRSIRRGPNTPLLAVG